MSIAYYEKVRESTRAKIDDFKVRLADAEELVGSRACVYASGSFGRLEAGPESDLDVFIVSDVKKGGKHTLSNIDAIKLKGKLISLTEEVGLPPFDGDGHFLDVHAIIDFVQHLGGREDDFRNALTGRMLLLLESRPLVGAEFYHRAIDLILRRYFRDFEDNEGSFVPAYLMNDIIRMWRTFCVNYEFWRRRGDLKSKIKNLKLKYHRLLTCYSAVSFLIDVSSKSKTVTPDDVKKMISLTPLERLKQVAYGADNAALRLELESAINLYSNFLETMHSPKELIEENYKINSSEWRERSHRFGKHISQALVLQGVGTRGGLHQTVLT